MILKKSFFEQKTISVAQNLLGKFLVRRIGKNTLAGMIVETEAYVGPHDLASHASKGKTERTKLMFEPAGTRYVYMIYGMYHCLNIVTEAKDYPAAVLIRALELTEKVPSSQLTVPGKKKLRTNPRVIAKPANGPGKLCRFLKIDKKINGTSAVSKNAKLYLEDREIRIPKNKIVKAKRVGVDYAGKWKNKPLRFYIEGNKFVSKK